MHTPVLDSGGIRVVAGGTAGASLSILGSFARDAGVLILHRFTMHAQAVHRSGSIAHLPSCCTFAVAENSSGPSGNVRLVVAQPVPKAGRLVLAPTGVPYLASALVHVAKLLEVSLRWIVALAHVVIVNRTLRRFEAIVHPGIVHDGAVVIGAVAGLLITCSLMVRAGIGGHIWLVLQTHIRGDVLPVEDQVRTYVALFVSQPHPRPCIRAPMLVSHA
mmetsp:Transcript_38868/g.91308  ORF Transcript_38868/g.91308 Transcript_38868/m.91308 type:complete len:218 (+) Transcript_38868:460-1113(+)